MNLVDPLGHRSLTRSMLHMNELRRSRYLRNVRRDSAKRIIVADVCYPHTLRTRLKRFARWIHRQL